jgi:hypothetical protein
VPDKLTFQAAPDTRLAYRILWRGQQPILAWQGHDSGRSGGVGGTR